MDRRLRLGLIVLASNALAWPALAADGAAAGPDALPAPALTPAPDLTSPLVTRPAPPGSPAAAARRTPGARQLVAPRDRAVFLRADKLEGTAQDAVEASGHAELRTRTDTVLAEWLRYDFTEEEITAKGNVLLRRGIDWITGPEGIYRPNEGTGSFTSPRYFIGEVGGRGQAQDIEFLGPQEFTATGASFTTCVAPREDWYVRMDELEIDESRKVGTAHGAFIYFMGAPIAYTPWLSFPLSNERKSGFLTPVLGSNGTRGFELATPYYLNLAPNYDATVTPRIMTKRGVQLATQFRYLFSNSAGEANVEFLPNDRVANRDRYLLSSKHSQSLEKLVPGLAGYWNLDKVSDDTYFSDLADRIAITSQTTLPREGGLAYTHGAWQFLARAQAFQTLQDPNGPPVGTPYSRMPQFLASMRDTDWHGVTFAGAGEYVKFGAAQPTGQRVFAYPTAAWARQGPWWFFTARTGVHARHYELDQPVEGRDSFDYAIPITSLDGGLVFERNWRAFDQDLVQTLEPRAYYVYIPYRNQSMIPAFDTAVDDYNFNQLFSENRYLGNDRIGDANQLTLAMTSRILDPVTGAERLRLAVGQRFYFEDQRVTLTEPPRSASTSDVLLLAEGRLTEKWSLAGLMQYNFDQGRSERFDLGGRYTPEPGKVLNASYRYTRQFPDFATGTTLVLHQFDISTQWPISANWTALARWNYSIADRKTLEAVAGIEYNAGCWVVRLVGQRLTTATQTTSSSVYLQLELSGLARFGTNPLDLLRRTVPGYLQTSDQAITPRERGDVFPEF